MKDHLSLKYLHQNLLKRGALFASFRLPEERDIFSVLQLSNTVKPVTADLINNEIGFLISPFNNKVDKPIWIQNEVMFKNGDFQSGNKLWQYHETVNQPVEYEEPICISQSDYDKKLDKLKSNIKAGGLQKAVFTRVFKSKLNNWTVTDLFNALIDRYAKAFVYLVNLPGGVSWIGASPETLLTVNGNDLETMALAGTRKKMGQNVVWGEKEIKEQKLVEQHIEEVFLAQELKFTKEGPETFDTGSDIEHLRTLYSSIGKNNNTWSLLDKLHPTPAVCGLPVELSRNWLEENEGYNRSYYSGFLGPVNMNGSSNFFVNLRCAQIIGNKANIYVGGGITESSDSQNEWTETELKSRTILNIIESKLKI